MPGEILLLNPRKRHAATKKRKTAVRKKARKSYARNPIAAPVRRRARRRANPITARRKYRRNPIRGLSGSSIVETLKNAAIGGAGALAVDLAFGQMGRFLPATAMTKVSATGGINPIYYAAKAALALVVGSFGGKLIGRSMATKLAAGSLTVQGYEIIRAVVPASALLPLAGMGYYSPGRVASPRVGAYVSPLNGLGRGRLPGMQNMGKYVNGLGGGQAAREQIRR